MCVIYYNFNKIFFYFHFRVCHMTIYFLRGYLPKIWHITLNIYKKIRTSLLMKNFLVNNENVSFVNISQCCKVMGVKYKHNSISDLIIKLVVTNDGTLTFRSQFCLQ